jgi:hypothetical protein
MRNKINLTYAESTPNDICFRLSQGKMCHYLLLNRRVYNLFMLSLRRMIFPVMLNQRGMTFSDTLSLTRNVILRYPESTRNDKISLNTARLIKLIEKNQTLTAGVKIGFVDTYQISHRCLTLLCT